MTARHAVYFSTPGSVTERIDPIFYADPPTAAINGLGLN
jgi:hypothetical protein